ncbi:MAG: AAA family ATPase, partial [Candidatus Limnocylindrales bacterium]
MTAPARLLSVRLQGFKSFAERTHVAFGPGISAVVGPNGSGKSNLADALRWALGEQGRALRSRKSEDVIWAGSERRAALGMADVQLMLDNADGLLPVEFGVVELGRRLYRSGENDYLLNRQRVRLRDLVDLLEAAHLAENAFLFIGQGMVDQALALRPEERRPLFEEVAGVRRHERRKRRAEEQLVEAEANLARVEDILAELRPQARRLAAQAEQQTSRRSAGDELAAALLAAAHARWHTAAARVAGALEGVAATGATLDRAMAGLTEKETLVATVSGRLAERARTELERRRLVEVARAEVTGLRLRAGRIEADLGSAARDRQRLAAERGSVDLDVAAARRLLADPAPARDVGLDAELGDAERTLAEALEDLAAARRDPGDDPDSAAVRRLEAARHAEAETARRRLAEAEREASVEARRAADAGRARMTTAAELAEARASLEQAVLDEGAAAAARAASTAELQVAEADARQAGEAVALLGSTVATLGGQLEAARRAVGDLERGGFAAAARAGGGQRLDRGVLVEPGLRRAVDAALGTLGPAFVVERRVVAGLAGQRGVAVVAEAVGPSTEGGTAEGGAAERRFIDRVRAHGGGLLADAIRRDERGALRRLLARAAWLPDLAACLELQAELPAGWTLVPREGGALVGEASVALGVTDGPVERQAEVERLAEELARVADTQAVTTTAAAGASARVDRARTALERTRERERAAIGARHRAEEAERTRSGAAESAAREAAWLEAQARRLATVAEGARAAIAA